MGDLPPTLSQKTRKGWGTLSWNGASEKIRKGGPPATGIGNVAAHELGHQFRLPDMDCTSGCDQPIGFNYDSDEAEPSFFLNVGSPLHWTNSDQTVLNQELFKK